MKLFKALGTIAVIAVLHGCNSEAKNIHQAAASNISANKHTGATSRPNTNLTIGSQKDLIGYWVGMFRTAIDLPDTTYAKLHGEFENKITIAIDQINGSNVTGHSLIAGNRHSFTGTLKKDGTSFHFLVREPGNDNYDGTFDFSIKLRDSVLTGTWTSNKAIAIPKRQYDLKKRMFRYDPTRRLSDGTQYVDWLTKKKMLKRGGGKIYLDGAYLATTPDVFKYNASNEPLTTDEVANLKKADIFLLRNSIYARHGYSFKLPQLRAYFDGQPWYIPLSVDVENQLTALEKKNIKLLLVYEKNAEEYYGRFGR